MILFSVQEHVAKLYEYRDRYFEHHTIEEAALKEKRLQEKLNEVVKLFSDLDCKLYVIRIICNKVEPHVSYLARHNQPCEL